MATQTPNYKHNHGREGVERLERTEIYRIYFLYIRNKYWVSSIVAKKETGVIYKWGINILYQPCIEIFRKKKLMLGRDLRFF